MYVCMYVILKGTVTRFSASAAFLFVVWRNFFAKLAFGVKYVSEI